jgi:hypothetical protein
MGTHRVQGIRGRPESHVRGVNVVSGPRKLHARRVVRRNVAVPVS